MYLGYGFFVFENFVVIFCIVVKIVFNFNVFIFGIYKKKDGLKV